MQKDLVAVANTQILWKVTLQFGQPFQMMGRTKEEAKQKCLDLGIGIYSSPIEKIEKIKKLEGE